MRYGTSEAGPSAWVRPAQSTDSSPSSIRERPLNRRAARPPREVARPPARGYNPPVPRETESVVCRLCGERYRLITHTHLWNRHHWADDHPSVTYKKRFGVRSVWSQASRRAMQSSLLAHYDRKGRLWTPERVVGGIRRRARAGKSLHFSAVWRDERELYWTAQRLFRSWKAALRAARIPEGAWPRWPEWTREKILEEIRARRKAGKAVHFSAIWPAGKPLYWAGQRVFGSYRAALRAAGVPPEDWEMRPTWTKERVVEEVRRRHRAGKPVYYRAIRRDDARLYKAGLRHHGNWRTALARAGVPKEDRRLR